MQSLGGCGRVSLVVECCGGYLRECFGFQNGGGLWRMLVMLVIEGLAGL